MQAPTANTPSDPAVRAVAALEDGLRRGIYAYIRAAGHPVTREQAASATGISRKLAAFHLNKLVEVGLLRVSDAPAGPVRKVGRRPKHYQPTNLDVRVSIPTRQHDELADILIDAVLTHTQGETAQQAACRVAHQRGHTVGTRCRQETRTARLSTERALSLAEAALHEWGFEPFRPTPAGIRLRNCPFHPMAAKAPDLVCGLNHAFLVGFLAGLNTAQAQAVLEPRAGECCVALVTDAGATTGDSAAPRREHWSSDPRGASQP
jgi:predicted ArsR family transcriptional regulator